MFRKFIVPLGFYLILFHLKTARKSIEAGWATSTPEWCVGLTARCHLSQYAEGGIASLPSLWGDVPLQQLISTEDKCSINMPFWLTQP